MYRENITVWIKHLLYTELPEVAVHTAWNPSTEDNLEMSINQTQTSKDNLTNVILSVNITIVFGIVATLFVLVKVYLCSEDEFVNVWIHKMFKNLIEMVAPLFWLIRSDEISEYTLRKLKNLLTKV